MKIVVGHVRGDGVVIDVDTLERFIAEADAAQQANQPMDSAGAWYVAQRLRELLDDDSYPDDHPNPH